MYHSLLFFLFKFDFLMTVNGKDLINTVFVGNAEFLRKN